MEELAPFLPLIVSVSVATIVSAIGLAIARKLGLTPVQAKYVETLEGIIKAFETKIDFLEKSLKETDQQVLSLTASLQRMEELEAELKQENFELRQELYQLRRRRRSAPPKEPQV